jgi:hypothetical protein
VEKVNADAIEGLRQLRTFIHNLLMDLAKQDKKLAEDRAEQYNMILDGKLDYRGRVDQ